MRSSAPPRPATSLTALSTTSRPSSRATPRSCALPALPPRCPSPWPPPPRTGTRQSRPPKASTRPPNRAWPSSRSASRSTTSSRSRCVPRPACPVLRARSCVPRPSSSARVPLPLALDPCPYPRPCRCRGLQDFMEAQTEQERAALERKRRREGRYVPPLPARASTPTPVDALKLRRACARGQVRATRARCAEQAKAGGADVGGLVGGAASELVLGAVGLGRRPSAGAGTPSNPTRSAVQTADRSPYSGHCGLGRCCRCTTGRWPPGSPSGQRTLRRRAQPRQPPLRRLLRRRRRRRMRRASRRSSARAPRPATPARRTAVRASGRPSTSAPSAAAAGRAAGAAHAARAATGTTSPSRTGRGRAIATTTTTIGPSGTR